MFDMFVFIVAGGMLSVQRSSQAGPSSATQLSTNLPVVLDDNEPGGKVECAQALLLLATAATQVEDQVWHSYPPINASPSNCWSYPNSGSGGMLKRQLEDGYTKKKTFPIKDNYTGNIAVQINCPLGEPMKKELGKRIRMDHNYAIQQWHRMDFLNKNGEGKGKHKGEAKSLKKISPERRRYGHKASHKCNLSKSPRGMTGEGGFADGESSPSQVSGTTADTSQLEEPMRDVYQPEDSKYNNFNLLLHCLTTEKSSVEGVRSRKRCNTTGSNSSSYISASDDETSGYCSKPPKLREFKCKFCFKMFTRNRYLTKHLHRMHPESLVWENSSIEYTTCSNCNHRVKQSNIQRHINQCGLAHCQFCGVRMRRHLLVKHLAQEHCVENSQAQAQVDNMDLDDGNYDDEDVDLDIEHYDSDWTTISGGEDDDDNPTADKDRVMCCICGIKMARSMIKEHIREGHRKKGCGCISPTSCSLCNPDFVSVDNMLRKSPVAAAGCPPKPQALIAAAGCPPKPHAPVAAAGCPPKPQDFSANRRSPNPTTPTAKPAGTSGCNHSMLQRFLRDSLYQKTSPEPASECQLCIGSLVQSPAAAASTGNNIPQDESMASAQPEQTMSVFMRQQVSYSPVDVQESASRASAASF